MEKIKQEKERMKKFTRKLVPLETDNNPTFTTQEQDSVEKMLTKHLNFCQDFPDSRKKIELWKNAHIEFLLNCSKRLSDSYQSLDASKPWLSYWIAHSLDLMKVKLTDELKDSMIESLALCQSPTGGFAGGKGQISHLAPTYAATRALAIIGTERAYKLVDRKKMYEWLLTIKNKDGSFSMHLDGESDVRSTYCAISVAKLLDISDSQLMENVDVYIKRCQSFEGGIGGSPFNEAHGGYTYCGVAGAALLGTLDKYEIPSLIEWICQRQMKFSGGFQGRVNKLVDGCYSFWLGACFGILQENGYIKPVKTSPQELPKESSKEPTEDNPKIEVLDEEEYYDELKGDLLFNQIALQEYVLLACQDTSGGLRDKPNRYKDLYHTAYCLAGVSIAQNNFEGAPSVLGLSANLLSPLNYCHNIGASHVPPIEQYFKQNPFSKN